MHAATTPAQLADHLPYPLGCRILNLAPQSRIAPHASPWAELNFALSGIMQLQIGAAVYLSPPHYAIWIPPGMEHCSHNETRVQYASIAIPAASCQGMPDSPCTLEISAVTRAVLADFQQRAVQYPDTPPDRRLAQVVIDQLHQARCYASYLPTSADAVLAPILAALQQQPGDKRGASYWAGQQGITERTLLRRCQQNLGMSFNEWRQRLRVVAALEQLETGASVQTVAQRLGYSTPSAFIAMFQRLTGAAPDSIRKRNLHKIPPADALPRRSGDNMA